MIAFNWGDEPGWWDHLPDYTQKPKPEPTPEEKERMARAIKAMEVVQSSNEE